MRGGRGVKGWRESRGGSIMRGRTPSRRRWRCSPSMATTPACSPAASLMAMMNLRLADPRCYRHRAHRRTRAIRDLGDRSKSAPGDADQLLVWPGQAENLPLLAAALPYVGHFQTRNTGTVCGSIAHADPSSGIPLSLAMLEGEVVLQSAARHAHDRRLRLPDRTR